MARGCGVREPGGIYFEAAVCRVESKRCRPLHEFLFDPPLPVGDVEIPNRGVLIVERQDGSGIHDVWDRVGESSYPNVADFIQEVGRMGLSRRAGKSLDFSLLGPGSLIFLLHPRAIMTNHGDMYAYLRQEFEETPHHAHPYRCPCSRKIHEDLPYINSTSNPDGATMCAGLWWESLTKAEPVYDLEAMRRSCTRSVGSTRYSGRHLPHGFKAAWEIGIFARFPISNLVVIADPEGGQDAVAHERLRGTRLPVLDVED